jgi:hypothetical protein
VNENGDEEHGVEVWDGRRSADDRAPTEAHHPIGDIVLDNESLESSTGKIQIHTGFRE